MLKKQPERDVAMKRQPGVVEAKSHEWKQEIHLWAYYVVKCIDVFWNYDDDGTDDDPNIVFSSVCCLLSSPALFFAIKDMLVDH